jgi:hypothetical protein
VDRDWCAKKICELGADQDVQVTVVNREPFHTIRVCNYEADLSDVCVPLNDDLTPVGIEILVGEVMEVRTAQHVVEVRTDAGIDTIAYDKLVLALGSERTKPSLTGLRKFGVDVDTFHAARRLESRLGALPSNPKQAALPLLWLAPLACSDAPTWGQPRTDTSSTNGSPISFRRLLIWRTSASSIVSRQRPMPDGRPGSSVSELTAW